MRRPDLMFVIGIAAATLAAWAWLCRPVDAPAWPDTVRGYSFSPIRAGNDPARGEYPTLAELDADLALIAAAGAESVRTYSLDATLAHVPEIAARHGLAVTLGVWLDADSTANAARLERLREVAAANDNIQGIVIGNEAVLREELDVDELVAILDAARRDLDVPISTAEPWHLWLRHPELAGHVDFISAHMLPYWEGIPSTEAVRYIASRMDELEAAFPGTPVVIGEVGWPSFGRSWADADASRADAAAFLRQFLAHAHREGYDYFLLEAFDQPWKRATEGEVGAYWGVYDAERESKFDTDGRIVPIDGWQFLALASALLAAGAFLALVADGHGLRVPGRLLLAATAATLTTSLAWSAGRHAPQYWSSLDLLTGLLAGAGVLGMALLLAVEAHEWAEARWGLRRRAQLPDPEREPVPEIGPPARRDWPKVSIHVPAHAEPPQMLIDTLRSLAALDYPDFEVLVIDNNTADETLWRPVEACCARLGERFRFFHVAPLAGYKAGALNFALRHTADDASIVAVVDSDYQVEPDWLRDLVPWLDAPQVAIVQAPQAYRDGGDSAFKTMCEAEYRGFFDIGMVTRNDRNAIIQHGTMTMIRRSVLEEVGGWAEWTITEDAELGLRVLEHGYEAQYTRRCYGRGLTPDNFADYRAQRYRWALGAIQILRRHRRELLGTAPTALRFGQRYHFVGGWLAWLGDGCNLLFNAAAIVWSALMIAAPEIFIPPLAAVSTFAIALFAFKLAKVLCLYCSTVRATAVETLAGAVAGLALVHVVGRAVVAGFYKRRAHFGRTPKLARRASVVGAVAAALPETLFGAALLASAAGIAAHPAPPNIDRTMWCALLVVFAIPHVASLAMSLAGALPAAKRHASAARLGEALTEARQHR